MTAINIYLIIIIAVLVLDYALNLVVDTLNVRSASVELPKEFEGWYDAEKYRKSQEYLKENTNFHLITDTFFTILKIAFILLGGFNLVDRFARSLGFGPIVTGLVFAGVLLLALQLISIPFSAWRTFVIEEKFGFNRTTVRTFIADLLKGWLLGAILGGLIFAGILWFFGAFGSLAWFYCWTGLTVFSVFLTFIAPVVIMPIFNKFVPLGEGELRNAIENYARAQGFKMKGVFTMDGSKRSTKSNAFFTGFGRFRRVVLFDTLIERHSVDELVSVLAHEIGHYKEKHIVKSMVSSILQTGVMFFILSLFLNNAGLFAAFRMEQTSIYASIIFFGFLYAPISLVVSIFENLLSRRHEYQADAFAARTYGRPEALIDALKKLSVDNLSNLTPHPLKVFLEYTHPPILERVRALRAMK